MPYNFNSGYGRAILEGTQPRSQNGKVFVVGAASLDNIRLVQDIFKGDPDGKLRWYSTLASALSSGVFQNVAAIAVTASAAADTFTVASGTTGLNNGDKVILQGTTAPSGASKDLVYYVVGATATSFKISLQRGGTAIDITTAGTAVTYSPVISSGDTIYVLPGHNENVSSATALNLNIAGVAVIGLGEDEDRPTFYLDTGTTSTITISAPAVKLQNVIIDATGFAAIASAVTITAPDVKILGCKFILSNSTNQAVLAITTTAAANRLQIRGNYFGGTTDAGRTNDLQLVGGNDIVIADNVFIGAYTTSLGAINNATTAGLRWVIARNVIWNQTASSTKCIVLVSTTTAVIQDNRMQILSGTAPITGAAAMWVGSNYYAATIATAGTLI